MSKREKIALVICLIAAVWFGSAYSDRTNEYNELSESFQELQNEYDQLEAQSKIIETNYDNACTEINLLTQENTDLRLKLNNAAASTGKPSLSEIVKPSSQSSQTSQQVLRYVWCSQTGTKYHSRSNCGNMKNPLYTLLDDAIASGRTPCSKCY